MTELKEGRFTFTDRDARLSYPPEQTAVAWVRPADLFALFEQDNPNFAAEARRDEEKNIAKRAHWEEKTKEPEPVINMPVVGFSDLDGGAQGEMKLGFADGRHRTVVLANMQQEGSLGIEKIPVLVFVSPDNPDAAKALESKLDGLHKERMSSAFKEFAGEGHAISGEESKTTQLSAPTPTPETPGQSEGRVK